MTMMDKIADIVCKTMQPHQVGNGLAVNTHCLYPSNGVVTVYINGDKDRIVVSDNGEAMRTIKSHGILVPDSSKLMKNVTENYGLKSDGVSIYSGSINLNSITQAVMLVANACAEVASYAISEYEHEVKPDFKETVYHELWSEFGEMNVGRNTPYTGHSNRKYIFDFGLLFSGKHILLDVVVPHSSSINAKYVAHKDIGEIAQEGPRHGIVFDNRKDWKSEDLILLGSAATLYPYDEFRQNRKSVIMH